MIKFPNIDPTIVRIGPIQIRWYGVMYVLGFAAGLWLIPRQRRSQEVGLTGARSQNLVLTLALGLMVGGRLGYILFYQFGNLLSYVKDPLELFAVWHGGMSFHGGLLGCIAAGWLFSRYTKIPFRVIADSVVVAAPVGLGMGRLGNFINGELYGRPTTVPWGMIFPEEGNVPRHPSQLYEALLEGFILFAIMWTVRKRGLRDGMMVALFVILYGFFRFIVEFFREPDAHLGFVLGGLSMGQVLCLIMIAAGGLLAAVLPPNPPEQKAPPEGEPPPEEKKPPDEEDRPDEKDRPSQKGSESPSE